MNAGAQRLCAWSGIACIVTFLLGFWVIAGFVPPPSPRTSPAELVTLFQTDRVRIRIGMIVSLFAAALLASWAASVTVQLRRMERGGTALAYTNLAVGALFVLEFIISLVLWQVCTFRPERSPEIVQTLNDTAWFLFVCITSTPALQAVVMGLAVLRDDRPTPIFPRWAGYLNLWVAVLFLPGTITVFFQTGPFAWNGVFTWYLPLAVFVIWMATNTRLVLRAVAAHASDAGGPDPERAADPSGTGGETAGPGGETAGPGGETAALRAEVAELRARVAALHSRA